MNNSSFLSKQKEKAYEIYNYFITRMIISILKICFSLAIILLISEIFDYLMINIIALIYTLISIYKIHIVIDNYVYILKDISDTLKLRNYTFVLDFNRASKLSSKGLNYGK